MALLVENTKSEIVKTMKYNEDAASVNLWRQQEATTMKTNGRLSQENRLQKYLQEVEALR